MSITNFLLTALVLDWQLKFLFILLIECMQLKWLCYNNENNNKKDKKTTTPQIIIHPCPLMQENLFLGFPTRHIYSGRLGIEKEKV